MRNQQRGLSKTQFSKCAQQRRSLWRFQWPAIHHGQFSVSQFRGQRRTQCAEQHFLRHCIAVTARTWSVHRAAMPPQRRPDGANACLASALLLPELAAGTGNFALFFYLVRAPAEPVQVPAGSFVQQMRIHLRAKYRLRQLDFADFLSIQIDYIHDWHNLVSLSVFRKSCDKNRYLRPLTWPYALS